MATVLYLGFLYLLPPVLSSCASLIRKADMNSAGAGGSSVVQVLKNRGG